MAPVCRPAGSGPASGGGANAPFASWFDLVAKAPDAHALGLGNPRRTMCRPAIRASARRSGLGARTVEPEVSSEAGPIASAIAWTRMGTKIRTLRRACHSSRYEPPCGRGGSCDDRHRLQRLCRYVARPPLANDRLEERSDGRVVEIHRAYERVLQEDRESRGGRGASLHALQFRAHSG